MSVQCLNKNNNSAACCDTAKGTVVELQRRCQEGSGSGEYCSVVTRGREQAVLKGRWWQAKGS